MTSPRVSVVVPLYNKAPFVGRCVASICAQTMADFEVIVVDDGSSDGSYEAFEQACRGDGRFRLFRQANGGVSRARNAALSHCRADWIVFLDADDEWRPDFLQAISAAIDLHPGVVLIGTGYDVIQQGQGSFVRNLDFAAERLMSATAFFDQWAQMGNCPLFIGACAARRESLLAVGGFEPGMNLGEELLTFIRLLELGPVLYVPKSLAVYYLSASGSLASSPSVAALHKHRLLCDEIGRQVARGRCPRSLHVRWLRIHADHLKHRSMRRELLSLLLRHPGYWSARQWLAGMLEITGVRSFLGRGRAAP